MANSKLLEIIRDSALILTSATILLFAWGYAYDYFGWSASCIPSMLLPDIGVQERTLQGGVIALFIYFPLTLVIWMIDKMMKGKISTWFKRIWAIDSVHQIVLVLLIFAASIALLQPIRLIFPGKKRPLRVEKIVVAQNFDCPVQPGMYCIAKCPEEYVFIEEFKREPENIYLIKKTEIVSLVLKWVEEEELEKESSQSEHG